MLNRYVIVLMEWRHEFSKTSHEIAREYARLALAHDPCATQATHAELFCLNTDEHVAWFRMENKIIVTETPAEG